MDFVAFLTSASERSFELLRDVVGEPEKKGKPPGLLVGDWIWGDLGPPSSASAPQLGVGGPVRDGPPSVGRLAIGWGIGGEWSTADMRRGDPTGLMDPLDMAEMRRWRSPLVSDGRLSSPVGAGGRSLLGSSIAENVWCASAGSMLRRGVMNTSGMPDDVGLMLCGVAKPAVSIDARGASSCVSIVSCRSAAGSWERCVMLECSPLAGTGNADAMVLPLGSAVGSGSVGCC